jgi:hypothetical protein
MEGRTLRRADGTYLARVSNDAPTTTNPHAVRIARRWEIEGYGATPEAAIADLKAKFPGPSHD